MIMANYFRPSKVLCVLFAVVSVLEPSLQKGFECLYLRQMSNLQFTRSTGATQSYFTALVEGSSKPCKK